MENKPKIKRKPPVPKPAANHPWKMSIARQCAEAKRQKTLNRIARLEDSLYGD